MSETELTAGVLKKRSKTHRRLKRMLFNEVKQDRMQMYKGVLKRSETHKRLSRTLFIETKQDRIHI